MPEMQPVSSSNLAAVGYDAEAQELTIEFQDGRRYVYDGIDQATYQALMSAASKGRFFYANIRQGSFRPG